MNLEHLHEKKVTKLQVLLEVDKEFVYRSHNKVTTILTDSDRARPWRWSTSQIPLDCQFWLVKFPQLLAILAT